MTRCSSCGAHDAAAWFEEPDKRLVCERCNVRPQCTWCPAPADGLRSSRPSCRLCRSTAVTSESGLRALTEEVSAWLARQGVGVPPVVVVPRDDGEAWATGSDSWRHPDLLGMVTWPEGTDGRPAAARAEVALGLPAIEAAHVMAHELGHACLGPALLPVAPAAHEGVAEACARLFLQATTPAHLHLPVLAAMRTRTDGLYGPGSRAVWQRVQELGLAFVVRACRDGDLHAVGLERLRRDASGAHGTEVVDGRR